MNIAHGNTDENIKLVQTIKEAAAEVKDQKCSIMIDTRGQNIRLLSFDGCTSLTFKKDDVLKISVDPGHKGNQEMISCNY